MNIGATIKAMRLKKGLTQAQASARMDRSPSYWADLEANRRSPGIKTLERVAIALGCRLSVKFISVKGLGVSVSSQAVLQRSFYTASPRKDGTV